MPNYNLVIDSTFQPFTYQELTAPLDRSEAYHERLAQEYDNLSSQADILEAMGKDDKDNKSGSYSKYKSYSDALRREAEDLYRYGLNVESRRRLSNMRRAYNTDIVPIQNAWNKRIEEAKAQQTAKANNPFLRFSREAANTDIDYYVNNPTGGYDVVNLESVYKTASNAFKNLSKLKREGKLEAIDPYTNAFVREYGIDPNLIVEWQRDPSKSNLLTSIVEQSLVMNGLNSEAFANSPVKDEARYAAMSAAWDAVGDSKEQVIEDYGSRAALNDYYSTKQKLLTSQLAAKGAESSTSAGLPGETFKINFGAPGTNGFSVNAIQLNDKASSLEGFLKRTMSRNSRDGRMKLYDIESINPDNTYNYSSEGTKISELPHTSSGKDIDWKSIHRAMLSNGDFMLYWVDDKGDTVTKVLKRSDVGEDAMRGFNPGGFTSAFNLYTAGKLTKEGFNEALRRIGMNNMANAYLDTQEVDVEDYKLK